MATELDEYLPKLKRLNETVWDGYVDQPAITRWLSHFTRFDGRDLSERVHALHLLSTFMYFGDVQLRQLLRSLYRDLYRYPLVEAIRRENGDTLDFDFIREQLTAALRVTRFLGVGGESKSGTHLLYLLRQESELSDRHFTNFDAAFGLEGEVPRCLLADVRHYVFVDDLLGTGTQVTRHYSKTLSRLRTHFPDIAFDYCALFATADGLARVDASGLFSRVAAVYEFDRSFRCFDESSRYFAPELPGISRVFAEEVCQTYGGRLVPGGPLGFGNSQLLLAFQHNTPNNTLPVFWADANVGQPWEAPFRRRS